MSGKKHIDRLFQEKFKDFEASPKEHVWKNIEKELKKKERTSFILPLWYKIAGVAAMLAVIFIAGNALFNTSVELNVVGSEEKIDTEIKVPVENVLEHHTNAITLGENKTEKENNKVNGGVVEENIAASKNNHTNKIQLEVAETKEEKTKEDKKGNINILKITPKNSKQRLAKNAATLEKNSSLEKSLQQEPTKTAYTSVEEQTAAKSNNQTIEDPKSKTDFSQKNINKEVQKQNAFASNTNKNLKNNPENAEGVVPKTNESPEHKKSLLEVAAAKNKTKETPSDLVENVISESSKWQVNPFAAPIYYNGFGGENALDPGLAQNESEGEITMSYGINFSYKVSERLKIRSGVSQVSMSYNVNDIAFVSTVTPTTLRNVSYNSTAANFSITNKSNVEVYSDEIAGKNPLTQGVLNQQLGFIEVPLEMEYSLIDKKFDLSIIGGASTLFLNENNIVIQSANGTTNIGEASNLNHVSFSTNIGLGLGYDLSKQFEISLEPMFKYQLNTFNKNINGFKPYYLGVYTGFSFKF